MYFNMIKYLGVLMHRHYLFSIVWIEIFVVFYDCIYLKDIENKNILI